MIFYTPLVLLHSLGITKLHQAFDLTRPRARGSQFSEQLTCYRRVLCDIVGALGEGSRDHLELLEAYHME